MIKVIIIQFWYQFCWLRFLLCVGTS